MTKLHSITLTDGELRALQAVAGGEGAEGLLTDAAAGRAYIGGPASIAAAKRALGKIGLRGYEPPAHINISPVEDRES